MQYHLNDYPLCIEPTAEILEVTGGKDADDLRWAQLHRVSTADVLSRMSGIPAGLSNFFGLTPELDLNQFLLAYTSGGRLGCVFRRTGDVDWEPLLVPPEAVGEATRHPSARLVFKDERDRALFLLHMQQIQSGKVKNPTLAVLLSKLVEPIRTLDVWSNQS